MKGQGGGILLCGQSAKAMRDFCKTPPFAQFRRQAQILILEILNVFLWLKLSSSLNLNKIGHFSKVSMRAPKNRLPAHKLKQAWKTELFDPTTENRF
jgi:hypothetical protein